MIDKIVALFATNDKDNHDLAVALMKGQGIRLVDVFEHTPPYIQLGLMWEYLGINPAYSDITLNLQDYQLVMFRDIPPCIYKGEAIIAEGKAFKCATEANKGLIKLVKENKHLLGV